MKNLMAISIEMMERILKGDDRCPIKIGARVRKTNSEPGDINRNGTEGEVIGNLYDAKVGDAYYVQFDTRPLPIFVTGKRLIDVSRETCLNNTTTK